MDLFVAVAMWLSFSPQGRADIGASDVPFSARPVRFVGRVVTPDGVPARGAVVTSSAGGRTVTGADGTFELPPDVPPDAESVDVMASLDDGARGGSRVATARVVPPSLSPLTSVGSLVLQPIDCRMRWLPKFGGVPGLLALADLAVFDDGSGPGLYAVDAQRLVRWDGVAWVDLGAAPDASGLLEVLDDGSGPALYVGGSFDSAPDVLLWDGSTLTGVGGGSFDGVVSALAVFDDGSGPALYAAGSFTSAGGIAANGIARWNGSSWNALGSGVGGGPVLTLAAFDDGLGPALYAGGYITSAGGVAVNRLARWDDANWSALDAGVDLRVNALAVMDSGSGPVLIAGGDFFDSPGGDAYLARWGCARKVLRLPR